MAGTVDDLVPSRSSMRYEAASGSGYFALARRTQGLRLPKRSQEYSCDLTCHTWMRR